MEQQASTSQVTVEYFDPHNVYELLKPGLVPRLPLRGLHWQSHFGPLRSIDTLHIELVQGGVTNNKEHVSTTTPAKPAASPDTKDDGFQTQNVGHQSQSQNTQGAGPNPKPIPPKATVGRRHQIPGLRRTPYLKMLIVRCDDNESYKNSVRSEVREWIKQHTLPTGSSKKANNQENHDAYEWLILHVVLPNTAASTQARTSSSKTDSNAEKLTPSRWRTGATPLLEKFRSDFNSSSKGAPDRIAQIRIGINDVPYDMLPRVVPAVPTGFTETAQDAERAWNDLITKFKNQILTSFDQRVTQYEEDIKEKHTQRMLPGWNFCTFFILKEGLALGFESVGLVEDALVGYDELNAGLDMVLAEQAKTGEPDSHGGAILPYTEHLKQVARKALEEALGASSTDQEETVNLQVTAENFMDADHIPISAAKKPYRDMILANQVSVFDFRCYIFARQIALLLRQANSSVSREQLLSRLKEQQETVLHGVAPMAKATPLKENEAEDLAILAEVCQKTVEFVPLLSNIMRHDIVSSLLSDLPKDSEETDLQPKEYHVIDNLVSSFAFSIAQQILAQTATKTLPIPPSPLPSFDAAEQKTSIPEPKTTMHTTRHSSLNSVILTSIPSPDFPGPGRVPVAALSGDENTALAKFGTEELAAGRAELFMMSRSILQRFGKKQGWSTGWDEASIYIPNSGVETMVEISLDDDQRDDDDDDDDDGNDDESSEKEKKQMADTLFSRAGIHSQLLITATSDSQNFYRLYETLTDRALHHYTVAGQQSTAQCAIADLAVLKFLTKEYAAAKSYFDKAIPFFGESGWNMIEFAMLMMYLECLNESNADTEYVGAALQLLAMYGAGERSRLQDSSACQMRWRQQKTEDSSIKRILPKLCEMAAPLKMDVRSPLSLYVSNVDLLGAPNYEDGSDGCSITIRVWSLLPDDLPLDNIQLKVCSADEGGVKELAFENRGSAVLKPGDNKLNVYTNSVIPGKYKVSHFALRSTRIVLFYDADDKTAQTSAGAMFRQESETCLYQRSCALDVDLKAARYTSLDKNNSLDLSVSTGWNKLERCQVRIKPSTGGLRLLTTEATVVESSLELARPPESGVFHFDAMEAYTTVTLRFPFSLELDVDDVFAKIEVTYVSGANKESYRLAKTMSVPVSLAVSVNVQDVFKHGSLLSRFSVTTASSSPLRLHSSELSGSELFSVSSGAASDGPVIIFPKQAASIFYRIRRHQQNNNNNNNARGDASRAATAKTLHLKLHYTQLDVEVADVIRASAVDALEAVSLDVYARAVGALLATVMKHSLEPGDLERAALLGKVSTSFLHGVVWEKRLHGLAADSVVRSLAACLHNWQKQHPYLSLNSNDKPAAVEPASILIPVEVPSVTIVHTADIRLGNYPPANANANANTKNVATPTVFLNQVLHATLHLKWTRAWDTTTTTTDDDDDDDDININDNKSHENLHFSYLVSASTDSWLIGGRRKGHFIIPFCGADSSSSSTTKTKTKTKTKTNLEMKMPLILIPQKQGWLPYPTVEIRELRPGQERRPSASASADRSASIGGGGGDGPAAATGHSIEVDYKNLGESIRVVSDKQELTFSLDASGPSGGPLVFDSESRPKVQGTRIVA